MNQLDRRPVGAAPKKFHLDKVDGKIFGVCSGLARYMNVDPMIVRAVFVIGTLIGFGSFLVIYLAIALLAD
jgi:phage shock protein PspC (stress-responsive transcriptional regulator)